MTRYITCHFYFVLFVIYIMKKIIGILGGMGPAATADMFQQFIHLTPATKDQEHIPLLISSIPDIPDRGTAILKGGESPLPAMQDYVNRLVQAGAKAILIACNTAHYWHKDLQTNCPVPIISMIETAANAAQATGLNNIGILATSATLSTGLYKKEIESRGLNYIEPDADSQAKVVESIYMLKAGHFEQARKLMQAQKEALFAKGAQAIILGCTEVPILLAQEALANPEQYIDATEVLVKRAIAWYFAN